MIKFPCPHCGVNISAEPEHYGASADCPSCGGDLVVPLQPEKHSYELQQHSRSNKSESQSLPKDKSKGSARWFQRRSIKACVVSLVLVLGMVLIYSYVKKPSDLLDPGEPLYAEYKEAGIWHTVYRKKVGGEFVYIGKSDKPFTGWVKMPRTESYMSRSLYHFTNGRMDKEVAWYENGQLWKEIIFDSSKPDTVDVAPVASPKRVTGVISVRQWRQDGEICTRTKVVDGEGERIGYDTKGSETGVSYTYRGGFETEKKRPTYSVSDNWELTLSKEEIESSPIYTQGYNKGREEAMRGELINANPYNELSEKKNRYIWSRGYSVGKLSVHVERSLLK